MRIIQLCSGYDIGFNGGITNYVRSLSTSLSLSGHDVLVVDSRGYLGNEAYAFQRKKLEKNSLNPFHLNNVLDNCDSKRIEKIFKEWKPEIIHIHMMIDLPFSILEIAKKYSKVIISLHDYSFICNRITMIDRKNVLCLDSGNGSKCNNCISKFEENKYTNFLLKYLPNSTKKVLLDLFPSNYNDKKHEYIKKVILNVDMLIAVSNRVKEIYITNGINNKKFIVNHIGNITAENFLKKDYKNKDSLTLGFIGNFSEYKGAELVVALANYLDVNKYKIKIFGRIDEKYVDLVKQSTIISYEGTYKQSDLTDILKDIDLGLVLPIWEDNAPQVVFEFLNNCIPVIGTRMGGIPDFVTNELNGYLIEPDIVSIKEFSEIMNSLNFMKSVEELISNLKPTKTVQQHNDEISAIYKEIL